ncbi:hypothetical protein BER93_10450 [Xanthomonas fragariae]|nr:hypothetical protein BER92_10430 [Xanthomonas fragariae]AOD18487.1 hypothetical protein BER93_10450 [Xanthomonas fragariae]
MPAILGCALLAIVTVIALLHLRTRKLLARKRELEQLVAGRTAELEQDKRDLEAARAELSFKAITTSSPGCSIASACSPRCATCCCTPMRRHRRWRWC